MGDTPVDKQINDCFKKSESQYYIVVEKLSQYNDALPTVIDEALNDKRQRFCLVQADEGYHNLIMQSKLHQMVHGFKPEELTEHFKDIEWNNLIITQAQLNSHL